jgi:hypothetical protein
VCARTRLPSRVRYHEAVLESRRRDPEGLGRGARLERGAPQIAGGGGRGGERDRSGVFRRDQAVREYDRRG